MACGPFSTSSEIQMDLNVPEYGTNDVFTYFKLWKMILDKLYGRL